MSEGMCSHSVIEWRTEQDGHGNERGWWECLDCKMELEPKGTSYTRTQQLKENVIEKEIKL